jgi:hypothetical protein
MMGNQDVEGHLRGFVEDNVPPFLYEDGRKPSKFRLNIVGDLAAIRNGQFPNTRVELLGQCLSVRTNR